MKYNQGKLAGGRGEAMKHLYLLAKKSNINIPAFATIGAEVLKPIEQAQRPKTIPLIDEADRLPDEVKYCWADLHDTLATVLAPLMSTLKTSAGLPVIKSSYLANSDFSRLSFAGVGSTAVSKGRSLSDLVESCIKLLRSRYKGYALYYRKAHPEADSIDIGLLAMEYLPAQQVWGTVWGCPTGYVMHCSREDQRPIKYATFMRRPGEIRQLRLPNWLEKVRGLEEVIELMDWWCQSGTAGNYFDIEFCINHEGQFLLTQWRPIPELTGKLLKTVVDLRPYSLGPTPFNESKPISGRLRFINNYINDVKDIRGILPEAQEEVWAIPYWDQKFGLFQMLVATHNHTNLRLPPLLILHDNRIKNIGHLHAIIPEDNLISQALHLRFQDMTLYKDGDTVSIQYPQHL